MSDTLSESGIVRTVADLAAKRVARKVIGDLQKLEETLAGDDSGLKTVWDAVCVQVQFEQSVYWDAYDHTVRSIIAGHLGELAKHEREAIWLQTVAADQWDRQEPDEREGYPVCDDEVVDFLASEYVYAAAEQWSNARIRAYLDRSG